MAATLSGVCIRLCVFWGGGMVGMVVVGGGGVGVGVGVGGLKMS